MRWVVPVNVPSRAKILKLYEEGPFKSPSTGRPWPGSLQTILGAPGSLKHVQPAFISVAGVSPSAVAVLTAPSDAAKAAITTMHLRIPILPCGRNPFGHHHRLRQKAQGIAQRV